MGEFGGAATILLAEDELEVQSYLEMALRCQGYAVETAQNGNEVLEYFRGDMPEPSVVLLDIAMPYKDGMETLKEIRLFNSSVPIIMVSGISSQAKINEALRTGANDFLGKPVSHQNLYNSISKALARNTDNEAPAQRISETEKPGTLFSANGRMRELQNLAERIGWSEAPVLIQGETGAGKEVFAHQIHALSPRATKPFLKLNCAALPSELVESELFGYERGAFTGAFQRKPGMFELADSGTIMLDEIGDMDFKLQAKLLQVLQDREFQRLGGKEIVKVDVRVIAATHKDLETAMIDGVFREDLYYRLNVVNVRLPALRDRREDIIPLAETLLRKHTPSGTAVPPITSALRDELLNYRWPGNIRELENVVRRLIIFRSPDMIITDLRSRSLKKSQVLTLQPREAQPAADHVTPILEKVSRAKDQAEAEAILSALNATHWNRKQAAALLKIDYKALLYKLKKLNIEDKADSTSEKVRAAGAGAVQENIWKSERFDR